LCDVGVNMSFHRHHILKPDYTKPMIPHTNMNPNVIVFSLFPGIQENVVRHVLDAPELKGIVMRSFGSGNAPQKSWIKQLLKEAAQRGITIVNISQCLKGTVEMARYDTGYHLKDAGVISGLDCTVEAAVTKLMYLHGRYDDPEIIREKLSQSIAGEMTCAKREA